VSEKCLRNKKSLPKQEPAYWRERLFKNAYTYKGKLGKVRSWSVKIQLFGKRKSFTLRSQDHGQAAVEACQIYQTIFSGGWESAKQNRISAASTSAAPSLRYDMEYWKQRLIHRRYPEPPHSQRVHEFSVCVEHACISQYFPLGTSEENEAAAKAMHIHQTVINKGWAAANACFPRELSLAFRWQDNPLAWTYTTIHTSSDGGAGKLVTERASPLSEMRVVFIEPDSGIRSALAASANCMDGFRCDATFAGPAEGFREIPSRGVDLAFANHDLPEAGMASLEDLQRVRPNLVVLSYSVFEDADHLFKSTPGGAVCWAQAGNARLRRNRIGIGILQIMARDS